MAAPLQLLSLGSPLLLTKRGEPIRFRTSKPFALLIRLAVEREKRFTREYLMNLLWPGATPRLARHSLSQALMVVKERVGPEYVYARRATVSLTEGAVAADVERIDAGDVQIRGQFLDGFDVPAPPFEHWKDQWRAMLAPRMHDCLLRQMDASRRIGDFAAVEHHARVLLELDPFSEDAVRGLIEARVGAGDRGDALRIYSRFESRLVGELGLQPSQDLTRIGGLLRQGRRPAPHPAAPRKVSEREERRFDAETVIGREKEFAHLYDAWLDARRGAPRIAVLVGDPGSGKTTLTNAFVSTCQMAGAVVARAQACDAERELPFAVLAELIRQLALQRVIGAAAPEALSELTRVSPDVFNVFPGVPRPFDWSAEVIPLRLANAFLEALEAAAEAGPLVLVVDDLHAADNASVAILHAAARKLPQRQLLLILTARAAELRASTAASALVSDSVIDALQTFDLDPLPPDASERLVARVAAQASGRLTQLPVGRILEASRGNPLALELLTKEWLAHGSASLLSDLEALDTQPVANLGMPRAIGAVFDRQIGRLDAPTRTALDLAAVLGRRLADLLLYDVVGLSPAAAGEALSRLKQERFLREVHGSLEFRNELIRAQAYYGVTVPAREHLHRSVGTALARNSRPYSQASRIEIAWHFLRGDDLERAVAHGLAGAEEALRVGAPYEAEQILDALLRKPIATRPRARVSFVLARALLDQSKAETVLRTLQGLLHQPGLSAREVAEGSRMRATAMYLVNEDTGQGHFAAADEALAAAMTVNDSELIDRALFEYARSGVAAGNEERVRAARSLIDNRLHEARLAGSPVLNYAHGFCDYFLFEPQSAAESLECARRLLADTQNIAELSFIDNGYGNCKYQLCEFESARKSYQSGLELASKIGDDSRASIISANLCGVLSTLGDYHAAIPFGEQSVALGNRALNQPMLVVAYTSLAEAYILGGKTNKALQCLESARDWVGKRRSWSATVEYLCQSACAALMMGNLSLAIDLIGRAEGTARGRERSVPVAGVFAKLRILRAAHVAGPHAALGMATEALAMFRGRHPLYYLMVLAAASWLEKSTFGQYSPQTEMELTALREPAVSGLRALQAAQGFST